jgi:type IV secretory pathway TrbL component
MANPHISNIGALIKTVACGAARVTAAGAGDNTAVTGATIDRRGYGSAKVTVAYKTTLASAETLQFAIEYQESDDNSSWGTATALQAATTAKTGVATNAVGEVSHDLNLGGKKRYIRFNYTPNLSAGSTDTADTACVCTLGGARTLPAA